MITFIIIIAVLIIAYVAISNTIKFKKKTKDQPNIIYDIVEEIYPKETREARIVKEINRLRVEDGLPAYLTDKFLDKMAERRSEEIDTNNEITHNGSVDEFIELKEKGALGSAELLAGNFTLPLGVVRGWMNSASHQHVMMSNKYDACAVDSRWDESEQRWIDVLMLIDTWHDKE